MDETNQTASRARPALGRGLRSLIPSREVAIPPPNPEMRIALRQLPVDEIAAGVSQPRQNFDEDALNELSASISAHGVLQPIVVRQKGEGQYEIVAGERRFRAAKRAGLKTVPCVISDVADSNMLTLALVENIQRQDLNAIEEAESFRRLTDELRMTQEQIAKAVGRDRATIANSMRLLKLPTETQALVIERRITMGHARALLSLQDTEIIREVAHQIVDEGMSVRRTEEVVQAYVNVKLNDNDEKEKSARHEETFVEREVRRQLEQTLGTRVELRQRNNKGTIVVHFSSTEQLNHLLTRLNVSVS